MKIIKLISLSLIGLILLLVAAAVVISLVVDPNDYKEDIELAVKDATGRQLSINGDISLHFFPWLGLSIADVELGNAAGFKPKNFVQLERAGVSVKLLPLLSKTVVVSKVYITRPQINLAVDSAGKTNWADLAGGSEESPKAEKESESAGGLPPAITIEGIEVMGLQLVFDDQQAGQKIEVKNLDLTTAGIEYLPNPGTFSVSDLHLAVDVQGDSLPNGEAKVRFDSQISGSLDPQQLDIKGIVLTLNETTGKGFVSVANFAKPALKFQLDFDAIDVDSYLPKSSEQAAETSESNSSEMAATGDEEIIPVALIKTLNIDGKISFQQILVSKLNMSEVNVDLNAKNGVVTVGHGVGSFYQGKLDGNVGIDVSKTKPLITIKEQLKNVAVGELLMALTGGDRLTGNSQIGFDLNTRGKTINQFKAALAGGGDFRFADGAVKGINLAKMVRDARNLGSGKSAAKSDEPNQTDFSELTGTFTAKNGAIHNPDLLAKSPFLRVEGLGGVDLVSEKIDYLISAAVVASSKGQQGKTSDDLKSLTIPVRVKGTFSDPKIKLDLKSLVKGKQKAAIAKEKKKAKEKLDKEAGKLLRKLF